MRVAVVQVAYGDDEPVAERVERVAALVRAQAGHDLVVLPELWAPGGFAYREWADRAEPVDGPSPRPWRRPPATRASSCTPGRSSSGRRTARSALRAAGSGTPRCCSARTAASLATYRKIHRFGFGSGEPQPHGRRRGRRRGRPAAAGPGAGLSTCYDLRFPELYRRQLDAGATVFVVPAAWPAARVRHWTLLAHARAIENQCVVIACNTAGTHAGTRDGRALAGHLGHGRRPRHGRDCAGGAQR